MLKLSRISIYIYISSLVVTQWHSRFFSSFPSSKRGYNPLHFPFVIFPATGYSLILEEEKEPNYLNAGVGEYAVFNCDLDFPHETPIPYILQWNRDVSPPEFFPQTRNRRLCTNYATKTRQTIASSLFPLHLFTSFLLRFPAEIRDLDARLDVSYDVEGGGEEDVSLFLFFHRPSSTRRADGD